MAIKSLQWFMQRPRQIGDAICFPILGVILSHRRAHSPLPPDAPTVAVLLYRKHVITRLDYVPKLIREFEAQGPCLPPGDWESSWRC